MCKTVVRSALPFFFPSSFLFWHGIPAIVITCWLPFVLCVLDLIVVPCASCFVSLQ